jgi:hypothetical protein
MQTALLDGENTQGVADGVREIAKIISSPAFLKGLNEIGSLVAFLARNLKLIISVAVLIGIRRLWQEFLILRLEILTTTYAAGSLGAALQLIVGGSIFTGLRSIGAIFLSWLVPLLRIATILGLVIELIDALRGKDTVLTEITRAFPTVEEMAGSEKIQKKIQEVKHALPGGNNKDVPVLRDSGQFNKDGSPKTANAATVIINAGSADPKAVANMTKKVLTDMFNNYEEIYA